MAQRTGRTSRRNPKYRLRLTDRDLWLLEGLAKMRFLTTGQLAKLYFNGSRWYANKRLRNLLDAGLIKAWVRNLAEENIYSITRSGLTAIENRDAIWCQDIKLSYNLDENLKHLLAINDVRTSLAMSLPEAGAEILWWRSDWELRSHCREKLIPDGLFLIKWHGFKEQAYALEVDNNTKSARNFLKKILTYVSLQTRGKRIYGVTDPIILVGCSQPKWTARYRMGIKQLRLRHQIWFAAIEEIKSEGATGAIWVNGSDKRRSLLELTKGG